jgi:phosphoribosyl 1,2-cyclic phosphate phosphodiesterase
LIDAGIDLRHQSIQHKVARVDAVIYTHPHADHILGTDDLRSFNLVTKRKIQCYGTEQTLQVIRQTFPYLVDPSPSYAGGLLAQIDLITISNTESFKIGSGLFEPFPLPHGDVTVTGFRIGSLGYATDCKGLSPRAAQVLHGVEYLFLDGLRWQPHNTHNSIDEAIDIARSLKAKQTYLIHTTHNIDYSETMAKLPPDVALGYDGLRIDFE